jgi:hypothetical protein
MGAFEEYLDKDAVTIYDLGGAAGNYGNNEFRDYTWIL